MKNKLWKKGLVLGIIVLFIGASVFPIISGQGEMYFYATQDIEVQNGGITGDFTDTFSSDDSYEGISERESGGKPSKRYSYLEHKWTISLSGSFNTLNFYIEAYHTPNSEGDDFVFAYSTNDVSYSDIITVTKTSDDDAYQSAELPNTLSGTIYIRVRDSDRSQGNRVLDTIFVDHMYIVGENAPDTTPPVISDVASEYNENTWYNMTPTIVGGTLQPREKHAMAFDSNSECAIMFGGMDTDNKFGDTWAYNYNNNNWALRDDGNGPSPRADHKMVYNSQADRTILFGGYLSVNEYKDTWAYDFTTNTWTNMTALPTYSEVGGILTVRKHHAMAYNSQADRIILYGGDNDAPDLLGETWVYAYNNNTWYNMTPTINVIGGPMPLGIVSHSMVYDDANDLVVMFGGLADLGPGPNSIKTNWTYVYDYNTNTWENRTSSMTVIGGDLKPRDWHMMCYDSNADQVVMFGGMDTHSNRIGDTWTYDASINTWQNMNPTKVGGILYPREESALVYDSVNMRSILFSGWYSSQAPNVILDTWAYNIDDLTATIITWTTDEPADSVVNYGTTTALGSTESDSALVLDHEIVLPNILPDQTYYFEVQSTDEASNTATDDNNGYYYTYTTMLGPEISNVDSSVNDNTWYNMTPTITYAGGSLLERRDHAMTFDSSSGCAILYGGEDTDVGTYMWDTWAYNYANNTWFNRNSVSPITTITTRQAGMAYDSNADKTIMFLGGYQSVRYNYTYAYDFTTNTWENRSALGSYGEVGGVLTPRGDSPAMAYDSDADRTILFGGDDDASGRLSETWIYNYTDNTWYKMTPDVIDGPFPAEGIEQLSMAYDDAHDCMVMFGGSADFGATTGRISYTYVYYYNNNTWVNQTPSMTVVGGDLLPRNSHSMAYDSNAECVFMMGGSSSLGTLNDIWKYDFTDNTWYNISYNVYNDNHFLSRSYTDLIYDSVNGKMITICGVSDDSDRFPFACISNYTWAFESNDPTIKITWTTDEPADSVVNYGTTTALGSTESDSALVLDHEIVLTDILPDTTYYFEVQATDEVGNTAIDDNNGNYYTFTTFLGPEISNVASTVNDNTWYNMNPDDGAGIDKRRSFSMAYNSTADSTIIYGGAGGNPEEHCYDTWAYNYNDNTWTDMNPVSNLGVGPYDDRQYSSMVYDSDNDMTILFGGEDGKFKDTWSYNYADNNWTNLTALQSYSEVGGTLTCRGYNKMVYNSSAQRVVMYGGWDGDTFYDETWTYDASTNTWTKMNPTFVGGTKYPRWTYDIAYDSANDKTILFGGLVYTGTFEHSKETWSYDYTNDVWTNLTAADGYGEVGGSLIKRNAMAMTYDSNSERVIMTCGKDADYNKLNDTWAYNSIENKWYKVSPTDIGGSFPLTSGHCMVYDSTAGRAILFGGMGNSNNDFNDTWTLNTNDPTAIVTWIADEPADSVVNYGTTTALGSTVSDPSLVIDHQIGITDILPDTTYYFEVQSTDESSNTAVDDNNGNYYTFFTGQDTTPPVISSVQFSGITHNSATITWNTDESSNSRVNYGTTTALGDTEFNSGMVTSHSIVLSDLLPETPYYYEVESTDGEGNTATDDNNNNKYSFTTDSEPDIDEMHVYSIDMWYEQVKNKYNIYTRVKIVNAIDNPVEGADVYIEVLTPVGIIEYYNDVTASDGTVTFLSGPTPKKGTYISTVTNVAKDGWTYNPDDNVETTENLVVP